MRFCYAHWDMLRDAIEKRGLSHLVSKSGEDVAARMKKELEGDKSLENFKSGKIGLSSSKFQLINGVKVIIIGLDPLMSAHNMILSNALSVAGLELMQDNEDGTEKCPICFLNSLDKAADGAKEYYDELRGGKA